MADLDPRHVSDYFGRHGTVERWWTPDSGPLSFHYDAEIQVLEDHLTVDPDWQVLDVGTGRGRFGAWFAQQGCRVVGVDVNPEMLDEARATALRLGIEDRFRLEQASAEDLSGLGDAAFDVVLCMELFDHLPDLDRALAEMKRTLKPDGRLLFTYVPSESLYGCLGNAYRLLQTGLGRKRGLISRTYTQRDLRRRLARHELVLERYFGIGLLCINAQTRLFTDHPLTRALTALARAEARRHPYYTGARLARHGAHVVGVARAVES